MKPGLTMILTIILVSGCNTQEKELQDKEVANHDRQSVEHKISGELLQEVIAIHDSIMDFMSTVANLKRAVSLEINTIDSLKRKEKGLDMVNQLEKADREMMGWMHQYKTDTLEKLDSVQAIAYVVDQKLKITVTRDQMNKSIADAKVFTEKK
jgi:hypothetical protein